MPTLAQSVLDATARREVDTIKTLMAEERQRTTALTRRIREARMKATSSPPTLCRPDESVLCPSVFCLFVWKSLNARCFAPYRRVKRFSSGHLLACHTGYVPVNTLQTSDASFHVSADAGGDRRIPGARGVGGTVDVPSLIPSALAPLEAALVPELDSQLLSRQRALGTLLVFYVKQGQSALNSVIANMVRH